MIRTLSLQNFRTIIFLSVSFLYGIIWFILSSKLAFGGDEIYTYNIHEISKPIPYKLIIKAFLSIFSLSDLNVPYIRSSSLLFMIVSIFLWIFFILKEKKSLLYFSLLILTNSLLLVETSLLRYYSYYFLTSTIVLIIFLKLRNFTSENKLITLGTLGILGPFLLYPINSIQAGLVFLYHLFLSKFKKLSIFIFSTVLAILLFIILNPEYLWTIFKILNFNEQTDFNLSGEIRGFSFITFIKPAYSFYQILFGYSLSPTSSIYIIGLFALIVLMSFYLIYQVFIKDNYLFNVMLFGGIIPLFLTFYIIESLSFSGSMLLYAKHVLFFLTFIIYFISISYKFLNKKASYILLILIVVAQFSGLKDFFNSSFEDWNKITEIIHTEINENTTLIVEDISNDYLLPYDIKDVNKVNLNKLDKPLMINKEKIIILLRNSTFYEKLNLRQNWDYGKENDKEVSDLLAIFEQIDTKYSLKNSYVIWPLYLYVFEMQDKKIDIHEASFWGHHLKDLTLPKNIEKINKIIISSVNVDPGDIKQFTNNPILIINSEYLSNKSQVRDNTIGYFICGKKKTPLKIGKNIWDVFSDFKGGNVQEQKIALSWIHTPLISSSRRYKGSLRKHTANLYLFDNSDCKEEVISISNTSKKHTIRNWILKN